MPNGSPTKGPSTRYVEGPFGCLQDGTGRHGILGATHRGWGYGDAMPASVWPRLVVVGLAAGLLSGLFGVGGGTIIVPGLAMYAGFDRKLATGTSLLAIVPTSIVGALAYGAAGDVSVVTAAVLALGAVVGAQLGAWMLARISQRALRWAFAAFLAVVAVQLLLTDAARGGRVEIDAPLVAGLVVVGLLTGVVAGLLGLGGGAIVIPAMILLFGYSDLLAKGTSLLMMVPTAVSGTVANLRRGLVDWRAGAIVGLAACLTVTLGTWCSQLLSPRLATALFAGWLVFLTWRTVVDALRVGGRS